MKRCLKNKLSVIVSAVLLTSVFLFSSCTDVDNEFGKDFIPTSDRVKMSIDSTMDMKMYTLSIDSMPISMSGGGYFGTTYSPIVGQTTATLAAQMSFAKIDTAKYFGTNPVVDSIFLVLNLPAAGGDTTVEQTLDIYELKKRLTQDSTYYSNTNLDLLIEDTPLTSYQIKGIKNTMTRIKLPDSYGYRLFDTSDGAYTTDSLFHNKFKGLCLRIRDKYARGAMYQVDLNKTTMILFYRNDEGDTLAYRYFFTDDGTFNNNVTEMVHDYVLADPFSGGVNISDINDTINPKEITYVHGFSGLMTRIEFPRTYFQELKQKVVSKGYKHLSVNKAELCVYLDNPTNDKMDKSFSRLGSYFDYYSLRPIYDYAYNLEAQDAKIPYGGRLDRTNKCYKIDISSYVQKIILGQEDRYYFELGPDVMSSYTLRETALANSVNKRAKLLVTYTMVK